MRQLITFLLCLQMILITACTANKPMLRLEPGVSLTSYKYFEVLPVTNETQQTFEFDVAQALTDNLRAKFEARKRLAEEAANAGTVLLVKSAILVYEPGNAVQRMVLPGSGKTKCTVRTLLTDKRTGNPVGEMVSTEYVGGGGLYSAGADRWILEVVATGIVERVTEP